MNVPYKIYGGLSFYQRKEIKDLLAYFRLAANQQDEEAFKRVINYPKRGIGKTSIEHVIIAANQYSVSPWEVVSDFNRYPVQINAGARNKITDFVTMIRSFSAQLDHKDADVLAQEIARSSGILKEFNSEKDKGPEEVERYQNIEELLAAIKEFTISRDEGESKSLAEFMLDVALLTDADQKEDEERNHVTMMTIHSSKGLEFQHVFFGWTRRKSLSFTTFLEFAHRFGRRTSTVLCCHHTGQRNMQFILRNITFSMGKSHHLRTQPLHRRNRSSIYAARGSRKRYGTFADIRKIRLQRILLGWFESSDGFTIAKTDLVCRNAFS